MGRDFTWRKWFLSLKKNPQYTTMEVTKDDSYAHLELGFKFLVHGVLGQTYARNYVSRIQMGVSMPVLGGERKFGTSSIYAPDCSVSKFREEKKIGTKYSSSSSEFPTLSCVSGIEGKGVVCKC
ncbi:hypothetical protein LIER_17179 [Lithospermum erythrorhizon]|uniref:Uncharacterized protein n=1 Tax=Lithospermum erythrorhizon TaxID=34254 RepID=A0AAV3QBR5_LITER